MNRQRPSVTATPWAAVLLLLAGGELPAQRPPRSLPQTQADSVKEAYAEVVMAANRSVVRVLVDGEEAALGTVVGDGLVVTKASLVRAVGSGAAAGSTSAASAKTPPPGPVQLRLCAGSREWSCAPLRWLDRHDLVLLRAAAGDTPFDLPAIRWSDVEPRGGALLACPDGNRLPAGIGVLSASAYVHGRAFLGVRFARDELRVEAVVDHGPSAAAGVLVGDVVLALGQSAVADMRSLRSALARLAPGTVLPLHLRRGQEELAVEVQLGANTDLAESGQEPLWGPLSEVRSGFSLVLQHDAVIDPEDCGGPLVDLDGGAIGINIARAGRVETLAVPAAEVRRAVAEMASEATR